MPIPIIGGLIKKGAELLTGGIIEDVGGIIGKFVTDPNKKLEAEIAVKELEVGITTKLIDYASTLVKESASIIRAEIEAGGLSALWRPLIMLMFGFLIFNNMFLAPYLQAAFGFSVIVTTENIPPEMWDLMKIGLGGYVLGRTVEKSVKTWKNGNS